MSRQALLVSDLAHHIWLAADRMLTEAPQADCGIILAECALSDGELRRLEKALAAEDAKLRAQYLYEKGEGVLVILLPGKNLSGAHFLSLFVKQFLQRSDRLKGGMLVAAFPECGAPEQAEFEAMLEALAQEGAREKEIVLYHGRHTSRNHPTILIIDGDRTSSELLDHRLQRKGYDVHTASDGLQGIRLCEQLSPDVVITELTLPGCDGYQVIRRIRESETVDSKIVVLSGRRLDSDVSACFGMGVADYVTKPYSPVELEARLRRLLG